jgi:hypothetical protein
MRGFSVVVVVALALAVSGCGNDSARGRDCSGGVIVDDGDCVPYSAGEKVAQQVAQMPVPPFNEHPLTDVTCRVSGKRATCDGRRNDGQRVTVRFTVQADGSLAALCVSPQHPDPPPNIFCAM